MLHVMVPDKENPSFDGHVLLDHRTVHLIECADGKSDALFNKIVRDSIIKVKFTCFSHVVFFIIVLLLNNSINVHHYKGEVGRGVVRGE